MGKQLYAPIRPGEVLAEDFLNPLRISAYRLAQATGLSQTHIGQIVRGRRRITPAAGLRLSRALGLTPSYWVIIQADYDTRLEQQTHAQELNAVEVLVHVA
ncbi:HigA family addiction module antitoxin [Promicromonospora sp. NPDC023987]|uniref:HigA family addiction module antitoxin n=1 Tax=Promicromonospora sp. NPDC023987 TaxID=3155360 RepID=UPI0033C36F9C